jgi:hypothetical protein
VHDGFSAGSSEIGSRYFMNQPNFHRIANISVVYPVTE